MDSAHQWGLIDAHVHDLIAAGALTTVGIAAAAVARAVWRWFWRAVRRDMRAAIRDETEPIIADHVNRLGEQLRAEMQEMDRTMRGRGRWGRYGRSSFGNQR